MPNKNAYLKPNRLPDVLAGIQIMALYERHRNSTKRWAGILSGDEEQGPYWKRVFDEHPEFFRKSANPEHEGDYSLLWRRALPQIYHRRQRKNLSDEELERIPHQERDRYVVRPSVPASQIKTRMDTALQLHQQ